MKKLIILSSILILQNISAQSQNVFEQSETQNNAQTNNETQVAADNFPGGPGDPVDIDLYIPFLLVLGIGMLYRFNIKYK